MGGAIAELDLDLLSRRRLRLVGVKGVVPIRRACRCRAALAVTACAPGTARFRTRSLEEHAEVVRRFAEDLLPALADRRLRPVIDRVFPLAAAAPERMRGNAHVGKIVLRV